ncbi:UPF0696 protein C11orf68 homolog [Gigantopelta aegis]|uniref:UPF0696 protein C11orf68 homolog n=1 Tax=Gigantopelta aegis TaxID=1735272 RepID=UPI001B887E90|nr:UPF0696 protein C11orf68 homolog [Gigantopelta aegis]
MAGFIEEFISYDSEKYDDLDTFLERYRPSKTKGREDPRYNLWIQVSVRECEEYDDEEDDEEDDDDDDEDDEDFIPIKWIKCKKEFEKLKLSNQLTYENIKAIARNNKYLSGKWLVYRDVCEIDAVWMTIANAVVANKLGQAAKVSCRDSPASDDGSHVICVYTKDFTDVDDVMRVELMLRQLGVTGRLMYKPDIYTILGIYAKNEWHLRPTIYSTTNDWPEKYIPKSEAQPAKNIVFHKDYYSFLKWFKSTCERNQ